MRTAFVLVFLTLAGAAPAAELRTLTGKTISGELVGVSEIEVAIRGSGGTTKTPASEILQIEVQKDAALPSGTKFSDVELVDGTLLHATRFTLQGKEVELKLAGREQTLKVPLALVASVLNNADDPAIRQEWQEKVLAKKSNQDVLAIRLNGVLNMLEGTLGEGNDKGQIAFEYESGGSRRQRFLDPARLQGMLFLRTQTGSLPPAVCRVYDSGQNLLPAAHLELKPASLLVTTPAGLHIDIPRTGLARLDYTNDKVAFLSDLKPAEVIKPGTSLFMADPHFDRNLENSPLQLEGQVYGKGLALHAHTELAYQLDGKYRKFEAVVGMDDTVGGDGPSQVKIEADGQALWSDTVDRAAKPRKLEADVSGVRQLRIVVTSPDLLHRGAHVDLANAKLSK
jgi:hypothetical protein